MLARLCSLVFACTGERRLVRGTECGLRAIRYTPYHISVDEILNRACLCL